jgi:hypothetical protein
MTDTLIVSESDLTRLRTVLGHLETISEALPDDVGLSLGNVALADTTDWLDCFIDRLSRLAALQSSPAPSGEAVLWQAFIVGGVAMPLVWLDKAKADEWLFEYGEMENLSLGIRPLYAAPVPAPAGDELRRALEDAYLTGAQAVHEHWCDNHGLEGGTHHLVAEPIARAEIERLRREVEELKAGNAALEGEVDFRGDALVKASVAVNASYAQAHAEWHGHDKVASRHDATVREGREAIREALDLEKMQARHSLAKEARHD